MNTTATQQRQLAAIADDVLAVLHTGAFDAYIKGNKEEYTIPSISECVTWANGNPIVAFIMSTKQVTNEHTPDIHVVFYVDGTVMVGVVNPWGTEFIADFKPVEHLIVRVVAFMSDELIKVPTTAKDPLDIIADCVLASLQNGDFDKYLEGDKEDYELVKRPDTVSWLGGKPNLSFMLINEQDEDNRRTVIVSFYHSGSVTVRFIYTWGTEIIVGFEPLLHLVPRVMGYMNAEMEASRTIPDSTELEEVEQTPMGIMKTNLKELFTEFLQQDDTLKTLGWQDDDDIKVVDVVVSSKEDDSATIYPVNVIIHVNRNYVFHSRILYNYNGGWLVYGYDITPIAYDLKDNVGAAEQAVAIIDHVNNLRKLIRDEVSKEQEL